MNQLVEKMAFNPAGILQINKGTLKVGSDADVVIVDTNKEFKCGLISLFQRERTPLSKDGFSKACLF